MQNEESKKKEAWWIDPMKVFIRVSAWIAVPIIIALFVGKIIDEALNIAPWGFLIIIGLSFFFSCYGIYREMSAYMRNLSEKK